MARTLVWFSCGAASAVAASEALKRWPDAEVLYCDTLKYEHPDNVRFLSDVEKWLKTPIKLLRSDKYADIFDVFNKTGYLVGVGGARCTTELKKKVRKQYQRPDDTHVFGFTADEQDRIDKYEDENPDDMVAWVLRDLGIRKADCYRIIQQAGVELPAMYKLGYNNNNCIGCVKGGMGRFALIFPMLFDVWPSKNAK